MNNKIEDMQKAGKEQMEAASAAASSLAKAFESAASEAKMYSKAMVENTSAYMKKLSEAKSMESLIEVQTAFTKLQIEGFQEQVKKMATVYQEMTKEASKHFTAVIPGFDKQ